MNEENLIKKETLSGRGGTRKVAGHPKVSEDKKKIELLSFTIGELIKQENISKA